MTPEPDPYLLAEAAMPADWRAEFMRNATARWPRLQGAQAADVLGILDGQDFDCGAIEDLWEAHAERWRPYVPGDVRIALLVARVGGQDPAEAVETLARRTTDL